MVTQDGIAMPSTKEDGLESRPTGLDRSRNRMIAGGLVQLSGCPRRQPFRGATFGGNRKGMESPFRLPR